MDPMRNQEGYHDPTACRAIQNVARRERQGREGIFHPQALTYRLEEIRAFQAYAKRIP